MRRAVIASLGLGLVALATALACVTPVIPLPPPEPAKMTLKQADPAKQQVVIQGQGSGSHSGVLFYIFNARTGKGQIMQAQQDGSYQSDPLTAAEGDELEVWTSRFGQDAPSSSVCVVVSYKSGLRECTQ